MDIDMDRARQLTSQLLEVRAQAGQLLGRLNASRLTGEQVRAETGADDPIQTVTGRTAIEQAIDSTTDMIVQMDRLIGPSVEANPSRQLVEAKANQ